ncbi:MAG: UDP-N-acetylmuramate dehydrogenase [Candidatus Cloacimonetes bacterium]|nr:UDP-N-acetylmuramate dehydrogenase [Candidatus Cloacimonadota bacterium]MBL7086288.1 UDP-N-acetylmuramate dehydrogenase [Candidatus Cloacimonadota bacterium]
MHNINGFQDFIEANKLSKYVFTNYSLKDFTSIKTGGPARFFVETDDLNKIRMIFKFICENNIEHEIIGNGSNLLISDVGYDGVVISLKKIPKKLDKENTYLFASANIESANLIENCMKFELSGLEFLSGIPGTVGGMIEMNAGAFEHSIGDFLREIIIINENGIFEKILSEDIKFDYRFIDMNRKYYIIVGGTFKLKRGSKTQIKDLCNQYNAIKSSKFNRNFFSFGSVFKNGKNYIAGELLDKCGLKGYQIGDAQVYERHANFIINLGNASSKDIYSLITVMRDKVLEKFNIELIPEVRLWGDFSYAT